jgi:predicted dehydrogenase
MPIPSNLDYEQWMGCTPVAPYTENRVHPQHSLSERPGWLRIESYCLGMITGWGSHHLDIAHWGMDTELSGPVKAVGHAVFPKHGLWNVHGTYHIEMKYGNGVEMIIDNEFPNGVRFEGDEGWIFVARGKANFGPDPSEEERKVFCASDARILQSQTGDIHLHKSADHHLDWLQSIQTGKPCATNPEQAHRSTSACQIAWIAMKLGREISWDPVKEIFPGDAEANALRSRPERSPYGVTRLSSTTRPKVQAKS